jgi:hypothetical protein
MFELSIYLVDKGPAPPQPVVPYKISRKHNQLLINACSTYRAPTMAEAPNINQISLILKSDISFTRGKLFGQGEIHF